MQIGKMFWKAFYLFHEGYKYYYIKLFLVFVILLTPLNAILKPDFYFMDAEQYQALMVIITILLVLGLIFATIIYLTLWRVIFPAYWVVGKIDSYTLGRLYWSSESRLANLSRRIKEKYGIPQPIHNEITLLINQGRLLNILNPWDSLTVLHLPLNTPMWRGPTALRVWEPSTRRKILAGDGITEYRCENQPLTSNMVETEGVKAEVSASVNRMVEIAQRGSHADVSLTKDLLADGAIWIPEDIKKRIDGWEASEGAANARE